jgi:acyl-CoA reductase-like NAD-dependent aldehyde dehydrogenase
MTAITRENPTRPDEIVGSVEETTADGVDAVVRRADAAQQPWAALSVDERAARVLAAADTIDDAVLDAVADLMVRELGKPTPDSRGEAAYSTVFLRYCATNAPRVLADEVVDDEAGRLVQKKVPFGVVAAITPWNAPIILAMLKVGPAIVSGNAIVVKPSPQAPLAVTLYFETLAKALPEGLLQVVHGDAAAGEALVTHPLVRKVAFTGGDIVARHILAAAAKVITPSVMELGGNDAAVFLDDATLDDAAFDRIALATFMMGGQVCMASKRIYVHRSRYDEFVEGFLAACDRVIRVGDPAVAGVTVGPVVSKAAQDRLEALAASSAALGGDVREVGVIDDETVVAGGYFVRPRVVLGLDDAAPLVHDEQFGPLVPILPFDSVDEVVDRVNSIELGLAGSVWSADEARAFAVAARLESGFVFINTHNRTGMSPRAPFGGVKKSGFGREYGEEGLLEYVQTMSLHAPAAFRPGAVSSGAANAYPV